MELRKKLLFFSSDSLPPKLSRGYWLATELSKYFTVYLIQWFDSRELHWTQVPQNKSNIKKIFISMKYFFKSLLHQITISKPNNDFGNGNIFILRLPIMLKGPLSKFTSDINARKISRFFNTFSVKRLLKKINIDLIFYADNFLFSSPQKGKTCFVDIQDDFDENEVSSQWIEYESNFLQETFTQCKLRFAITEETAQHFGTLSNTEVLILPNGADFVSLQNINTKYLTKLRNSLGIKMDSIIVSYIGGDVWFDSVFVSSLVDYCNNMKSNIHFLFIGNLPKINKANVSNLGLISPTEIHYFYQLSDIGILPKDSQNDAFLRNSHPLKIVQYSGAKRPVISPSLSHFQDIKPSNLFQLPMQVEKWYSTIIKLKHFTWTIDMSNYWKDYSWEAIGEKLYQIIAKTI